MPLNSTRGAASAKGFGFTAGDSGPPIDFTDWLVVAGGGAGGNSYGGGGGGGGVRFAAAPLSVRKGTYTITVGAGGTGPAPGGQNNGNNSVIGQGASFQVPSTGGGGGGQQTAPNSNGFPGGAGGGAGPGAYTNTGFGGSGNAGGYPVSEGANGGTSPQSLVAPSYGASGGGGGGNQGQVGSWAVGGGPGGNGNTKFNYRICCIITQEVVVEDLEMLQPLEDLVDKVVEEMVILLHKLTQVVVEEEVTKDQDVVVKMVDLV
jgi:hypothetical protein